MPPKHCQGCAHFHNAGHKNPTKHYQQYNAWCCAKSAPAKDSVGWCKQHGKKEPTGDNKTTK